MNNNTVGEYKSIMADCLALFEKKHQDYGSAWRILRIASITDQIYIKAKRIRSIQQNGIQKVNDVNDDIRSEFKGIINYCIMALMQISFDENEESEIAISRLKVLYNKEADLTLELLLNKNHDYGEAWRDMRVASMTDIILMKLLRIKQIEDNAGATVISEGIDAGYRDIINYSVFCLIMLQSPGTAA